MICVGVHSIGLCILFDIWLDQYHVTLSDEGWSHCYVNSNLVLSTTFTSAVYTQRHLTQHPYKSRWGVNFHNIIGLEIYRGILFLNLLSSEVCCYLVCGVHVLWIVTAVFTFYSSTFHCVNSTIVMIEGCVLVCCMSCECHVLCTCSCNINSSYP